ncbi:MAG: patatin-like phospholipase family protein [Pseudomonadales bacterium]
MSAFPLTLLAGRSAYAAIASRGWQPDIFSAMVGASGGAKLLGLTHLDRYLFGTYLQQSDQPMELYGSSIGSWRHAALTAPDPLKAITELQERYLNQAWDEDDPRSPGEIVDELCEWVLDGYCTEAVQKHLSEHPRFTTHIVTARGLGLNNRGKSLGLGLGMGLAAIGNLASRRLLAAGFQRVVFSSGAATTFNFQDFNTIHVPLTPPLVKPALLASGSIPFLMSGQRDLAGAPRGLYWDGGVIDYHFDFSNHRSAGLILYPHFTRHVVKGWFDKSLPWRRNQPTLLDRTVVVAPSENYIASLPHGKIPDRKDFSRMSQVDRMNFWREAMASSQALADAFHEVVTDRDPLRYLASPR